MDVCTLVIAQFVTLLACTQPVVCRDSEDGKRKLCTGGYATACPTPPPAYECKRPDGTVYTLPQDAK